MEREQVNLEELQTTWRQLGNESVMYPMEMSDVGVKIGLERQLFVDDHLSTEHGHNAADQPLRHQGN